MAMFFDIEKAHDTTWRHKFLQSIHQFGLRGPLKFIIENLLKESNFNVQISNKRSEKLNEEQWMPLGSVLSVTLFLIAITDVVKEIAQEINKTLYVDDLAIYNAASTINHIQQKLQLTIKKLEVE